MEGRSFLKNQTERNEFHDREEVYVMINDYNSYRGLKFE